MIGDWREWEPKLPTFPYSGHEAPDDPAASYDPYGNCKKTCHHDLARTALMPELLAEDGPFPDNYPLQPPLGAGGILNGLRRAMPNMPRAQTSPAS